MNKADLHGRLVRDPEVNQTATTTVTKFTVAVDRKYKKDGEQTADFISCVSFGKTAEIIGKFFHKGSEITVSGRIQTGSYTNKNGQKVYTTDVVVEEFDFCGNKGQSNSEIAPSNSNDFMPIPQGIEDDLPFSQPNTAKPVQQTIDDLPFART